MLALDPEHLGREALDAHQSEPREDLDPRPSDVDLPPLDGELGGARIGVMVVVELLPADKDPPRHEVRGGVRGLEVAVAGVVAHPVDDPGREERDPRHLDGPDGEPDWPEEEEVDGEQDDDARVAAVGIDAALEPVVGGAVAVAVHHLLRMGEPIDLHPFEEDLGQPQDHRAVGVLLGLGVRVVHAVDRGPPLGVHPGGEPEPEAEHVGESGMDVDGPVRRVPVQVHGHRDDGEVGEEEGRDRLLPEGKTENSVKSENRVQHGVTTLRVARDTRGRRTARGLRRSRANCTFDGGRLTNARRPASGWIGVHRGLLELRDDPERRLPPFHALDVVECVPKPRRAALDGGPREVRRQHHVVE